MKVAGLGSPIAHSLSPVLHRAAYRELGLDDWSYQAIDCDEARLPALLDGCGPDWAGLSLTMPLKRTVLPLLDVVDPLARDAGAANTVVLAGGHRHGYNTDVPGMITALTEAGMAGPAAPVRMPRGGAAGGCPSAVGVGGGWGPRGPPRGGRPPGRGGAPAARRGGGGGGAPPPGFPPPRLPPPRPVFSARPRRCRQHLCRTHRPWRPG